MNIRDFTCSELALFAWRHSRPFGGFQHGKAILHCLANRVRMGMYGGDWLKVLENAPQLAYNNVEEWDRQSQPDFYDRDFEALRREAEDIYDGFRAGKMVTSFMAPGAFDRGQPCLYWADVGQVTRQWFKDNILANRDEHPRLVEVQPLIFFA